MLDALSAEVARRKRQAAREEGTRVFVYSDIRKWIPEWARTGPRDLEEDVDAAGSVSKDIRDLAKVASHARRRLCFARARVIAPQEVAAVKKGPEKKAFSTVCQWQLAWDGCHQPRRGPSAPARACAARGRFALALVATGQLTLAETVAHRSNCLKIAVQAVRA